MYIFMLYLYSDRIYIRIHISSLCIYMLIKTEYTVIFKFKYVSTTVFLNFLTLHVYSSDITAIFYYYIKKLLITE